MMALEINRDDAARKERDSMAKSGTVAGERIYETTDGKLVREGDARAAFLVYGPGDVVKDRHADEFNELTGKEPTGAARAYVDDDKFAEMSLKQARPEDSVTRPGPVLVGEKLATELADEARRVANSPVEVRAEVLATAVPDDDAVFTTHAVYATEDGTELVHEGDARAFTQKYAPGDRVAPEDVDRFKELGEPAGDDGKGGDKPADKSGPVPANKAATTTARRR
jgi:hypothetical protein